MLNTMKDYVEENRHMFDTDDLQKKRAVAK
jgi:hypothetical protein